MTVRPVTNGAALAKSRALVDETVALRRCALFRDAFKGAAVSYPAALLGFDTLATWVRRQGVTVDVTSAVELAGAMAEGIDPMHIVIHAHDGATASVRRAVSTGAARFVVGSSRQIAGLAESADRVQRVVIDTTAMDALTSEVLAQRGLELIGLHRRLDDPDDAIGMVALREMIAQMARIRRKHGVLLSRVSLAGLDVGERCLEPRILRRVAAALNEVIGDACARHAFPRPGLTVSPTRSVLLPAA